MKKITWLLLVPGALAIVLVSALVLAADIPADKAEMSINIIGGKQGPAKFPHAKHAKEFKKDGAAITCKECHHTLKAADGGAEKVEGCPACHVKEGEAQKEFEGKKASFLATMKGDKPDMKSVVFHKKCVDGCHKAVKVEGKNLTACKTCHAK